MDQKYDVVVVGAGLAGLRTAQLLVEIGAKVKVLEARSRVGGRMCGSSVDVVDGQGQLIASVYVDKGAMFVGPTQHRLLRLAADLGVETVAQRSQGNHVLQLHGLNHVYTEGKCPPAFPVLSRLSLQLAVWQLDSLARRVPVTAPWLAVGAQQLDAVSAEDWIRDHVWFHEIRETLRVFVRAVFLAETSVVSMLWLLTYVRSAGGHCRLLSDIQGCAQERRFLLGADAICQRLAARLPPRTLQTSSPVTRIEHRPDYCQVETQDGDVLECATVVCAMSPQLLAANVTLEPEHPRQQLGARCMFAGQCVKFAACYQRPFWRDHGFSGTASTNDRLIWLFDCSTDDEKAAGVLCGALLVTLDQQLERLQLNKKAAAAASGDRDDAVQLETEADRKQLVSKFIESLFSGDGDAPPPPPPMLQYTETDWSSEQFTLGGVNGTYPTGLTEGVSQLGTSLANVTSATSNLFFAGTETAVRWNGYMDGAVQSGEAAALAVCRTLMRRRGGVTSNDVLSVDGTELARLRKGLDQDYADCVYVSDVKRLGLLIAHGLGQLMFVSRLPFLCYVFMVLYLEFKFDLANLVKHSLIVLAWAAVELVLFIIPMVLV